MVPGIIKQAIIRFALATAFIAGAMVLIGLDGNLFLTVSRQDPLITVFTRSGVGLPLGIALLGFAAMMFMNQETKKLQERLMVLNIIAVFILAPVSVLATQFGVPHYLRLHSYQRCENRQLLNWSKWWRGDKNQCQDAATGTEDAAAPLKR